MNLWAYKYLLSKLPTAYFSILLLFWTIWDPCGYLNRQIQLFFGNIWHLAILGFWVTGMYLLLLFMCKENMEITKCGSPGAPKPTLVPKNAKRPREGRNWCQCTSWGLSNWFWTPKIELVHSILSCSLDPCWCCWRWREVWAGRLVENDVSFEFGDGANFGDNSSQRLHPTHFFTNHFNHFSTSGKWRPINFIAQEINLKF